MIVVRLLLLIEKKKLHAARSYTDYSNLTLLVKVACKIMLLIFLPGNPKFEYFYQVTEPATGKLLCEVPVSGQKEVHRAVAVAKNVFPTWSKVSRPTLLVCL